MSRLMLVITECNIKLLVLSHTGSYYCLLLVYNLGFDIVEIDKAMCMSILLVLFLLLAVVSPDTAYNMTFFKNSLPILLPGPLSNDL